MAEPRPSTDQETAPLLDEERRDEGGGILKVLFGVTHPLTQLEKLLAGATVVLFVLASLFVGMFAGTEHLLKKERSKPERVDWHTVTQTQTATRTATTTYAPAPTGTPQPLSAMILASLNTSVDPCDDFYAHAAGGWEASHDIPADRGLYGSFHEVADNNKKILLRVIDAIPDKLDGSKSAEADNLRKLKQVYTSCSDIDALNEIGIAPFVPIVDVVLDSFGPFDVAAADSSSTSDAQSWRGAYTDDYVAPASLQDAALRGDSFKASSRHTRDIPAQRTKDDQPLEASIFTDKARSARITKTLAYLHSRGIGALLEFAIEGDSGGEDSQIQALNLYQASGGLPSKEYYEEAPIMDLYQSVVAKILGEIAHATDSDAAPEKRNLDALVEDIAADLVDEVKGWPWPWPGDDKGGGDGDGDGGDKTPPPPGKNEPFEVRMDKLAGEVVAFERELMRAGTDPEYLSNPHYSHNPRNTSDVDAALSFLSVPAYLSTFAPRVFPTEIGVTFPPYLESVDRLVAGVPDRVLSAYFVTRAALAYAPALGPKVELRQATRRLEEVLRGLKKGTEENRVDVCLAWVDNIVGYIAGREFVREAFSPEAKADAEHIIRSIVQAFDDKLPHIAWMDSESAHAAQKKARAIIPKIGYPLYPNTTNPDSLAAWYARVDVQPGDFFGTVLSAAVLDETRVWAGLGRRRNRDSWEMTPQTVNAYYSPPDGEIVFPAGILQPPTYSLGWPSYLKYGSFGSVAAHELTHAFDNTGSQYDEAGRLRNWWTNATVEAFEERAQCIARQYSHYYVLDDKGNKVYVNGNLTNGEDIADSGLAQAYAAWRALDTASSVKDTVRLPGLDYTPEQLFFLAFARGWAQLTRPATAVSRVRTDPHSPLYWRAVGTLRNLDAFHEAFGCKVGSNMNPPKKEQCELW